MTYTKPLLNEQSPKPVWYKRPWLVAGIVIVGLFALNLGDSDDTPTESNTPTAAVTVNDAPAPTDTVTKNEVIDLVVGNSGISQSDFATLCEGIDVMGYSAAFDAFEGGWGYGSTDLLGHSIDADDVFSRIAATEC
jgi:hypothetical protein